MDLGVTVNYMTRTYSNFLKNNEAKRNTKNVNGTEKFALEKTGSTQELSEAEEMELFNKEYMKTFLKSPTTGRKKSREMRIIKNSI